MYVTVSTGLTAPAPTQLKADVVSGAQAGMSEHPIYDFIGTLAAVA